MKKIFYFILILIITSFTYNCTSTKKIVEPNKITLQQKINPEKLKSDVLEKDSDFSFNSDSSGQKKWVDSIFNLMTFDEKLGQLFMVSTYSNRDSIHFKEIDKLIADYKIGSLIFFQGGPVRQAKLTNRFQSKSKIPLFIAIDGEWGLAMRLDSTYSYPWNMTLGAIKDKRLIEKVGVNIGKHTKRMGIHFNFGPVLDININPKNPIIGFRSFGENKDEVTENASLIMKGLQSQNIMATGKHFPGHGDTDVDSHNALPTLNFSKERLNDIEIYPYKKLIKDGMASVMVAHLNIPSLEPKPNTPSSVSYNIVTKLLKEELGFKGLIFTDALNMKGASNFKKPGEIDLDAFLAGNDMLLCPDNVPVAIEMLKKAHLDSLFSDARLEYSVKKILKYKYKAGLNNYKPIVVANLQKELNTPEDDAMQYQLYENAITILKNENNILPLQNLEGKKIAYVKMGDASGNQFLNTLKKYTDITEVTDETIDGLNIKLKNFNTIVIGFHKSDKIWKKHFFSDKEVEWVQKISENNDNVILDVMANPYSIMQLKSIDKIKAIAVTFQNGLIAQEVSASMLFGAIETKGKLPVSIGNYFKIGTGLSIAKLNRLGFSVPENVGMNNTTLNKIDAVAQKAIDGKMAPGVQVLVARKGKIIFHKSYGNFEYDNVRKVKNTDTYDIASLTKILATLPMAMQQYDNQKFNLESKLGDLLPSFANSNKSAINFKDFMTHNAQLQAWIPFYKATLDANKKPSEKYYSKIFTENFSNKVADSLYIRNDYNDTIIKMILYSKLTDKKEYKYSDFTFILLKEIVEKVTSQKLDVLVHDNFYKKLGANNTFYNPLSKLSRGDIVPTENDTYFRYQKIQGYVHDMAAAMQGGVAGHAGLFSNAIDIAKIMQMYLQKGNYGGQQFFTEKTFEIFNSCHFCSDGNRRGLGFDKPQLNKESNPTCNCVSSKSFGHTGFTGTMTWADPETEIVYVFLSNRTFPDGNASNLLTKNGIREEIQQIIQDAIVK